MASVAATDAKIAVAEATDVEPKPENPPAAAPAATSAAQPVALKPVEAGSELVADGRDSATQDVAADETDEEADSDAIGTKKRGFLSAFFSTAPAHASPAVQAIAKQPAPTNPQRAIITLASAGGDEVKPINASLAGGDDALPGVRKGGNLFEITSKSNIDDDSDVDVYEDVGGSYQVASAAGLGRMSIQGLVKQRDDVEIGCFKPALMHVLGKIEQHYGKGILITSGYRSPSHNHRVNGARKSLHMYCAAADIKVAGVSKWDLARYVRSMPGRGGVGTYCHTDAIHVDVGPERDWNWRCHRRRQ